MKAIVVSFLFISLVTVLLGLVLGGSELFNPQRASAQAEQIRLKTAVEEAQKREELANQQAQHQQTLKHEQALAEEELRHVQAMNLAREQKATHDQELGDLLFPFAVVIGIVTVAIIVIRVGFGVVNNHEAQAQLEILTENHKPLKAKQRIFRPEPDEVIVVPASQMVRPASNLPTILESGNGSVSPRRKAS